MPGRRLHSLGVVPLAIAGVAALGVSPTITPTLAAGVKTVLAEAKLLDTESWIMGGSGMPIPPPDYLTEVSERYIDPASPFFDGQPRFPVDATNPLFTPEGLYPTTVGLPTGVKSLELDPSVAQGVSILNSTITNQIADGNNLVVLGYSQSAAISSLEMRDLQALPVAEQPTADQLSFVLIGDPSNPDGGLLERFNLPDLSKGLPPLTIPSLGITFSGATPADTPWDTAIYTGEYDGYADFPRYPIDLLSDINALLGAGFVHDSYPTLTDAQMASAIELPVSADYTGHTQYFMIPTQDLPLLDPVRIIPVVGNPLADLLQPDLKVLVNLGYGSITDGWDQGPANVPTPFGLFPTHINPADVLTALVSGAQQGIQNFIHDLGSLSLPDLSEMFTTNSLARLGSEPAASPIDSLTGFVNALSGDAATAYATLLPTADIVNALFITLPAYDASLFVQELASGNLLDAIGLPVAADLGLGTMAVGFELDVIVGAVTSILGIGSPLDLIPS